MIAEAALQEDVDVVGLSISPTRIWRLFRSDRTAAGKWAGECPCLRGGIIRKDIPALKAAGVREVMDRVLLRK